MRVLEASPQRRVGQILSAFVLGVAAIALPTGSNAAPTPLSLLPDTSQNIHLGMMYNHYLDTSAMIARESGVYDVVFGAEAGIPEYEDIPAAGVVHTYYIPYGRDNSWPRVGLTPYLNNHPDWIVYQNDRKTPAWYPDDSNRAPLDYTNPAVMDYVVNTWAEPALVDGGYAGVAFDQGWTYNEEHRAGVYQTAGTLSQNVTAGSTSVESDTAVAAGTSIAIGNASNMEYLTVQAIQGSGPYMLTLSSALQHDHLAGEWLGTWKQQYSGAKEDNAYRQATIGAFAELVRKIRAAAPSALIAINDPIVNWDDGTDQNGVNAWQYFGDLLPYTDMVVDECGFTECGNYSGYLTDTPSNGLSNPWLYSMQQLYTAAQSKAVMVVGYEPFQIRTNSTQTNSAARAGMQWCLANYLLVRGDHTYLFWGNDPSGPNLVHGDLMTQPEEQAQVGAPTDAPYQSQGVWMRDYTGGLAVVNPSAQNSYTISLAPGYQDLYGNALSTYTLPPHSGLVLVKTSTPATAAPVATSAPTSPATSTPLPTDTPPPAVTPTSTPLPTSTPFPTRVPYPPTTTPPAATPAPPAPTSVPPGGVQLIANPSFENGRTPWTESSSDGYELITAGPAHSGSHVAWLCGSTSCDDQIAQSISLPGSITQATLSYWMWSRPQGTSSQCQDKMTTTVTIGSTSVRLDGLCNSDATAGWTQRTLDVSSMLAPLAGQRVQLAFTGTTTSTSSTNFLLDDFSLTVSGSSSAGSTPSTPVTTPAPTATQTPQPQVIATSTPVSPPTLLPATAMPTAPSIPTVIPVSAPAGDWHIRNGGFENGPADWILTGLHSGTIVTGTAHSGSRSAMLCGQALCHDQIAQTIHLPNTFSRVTLSYWERDTHGLAANPFTHALTVTVQGRTGVALAAVPVWQSSQAGWQLHTEDLTAALLFYAGQDVTITIQANTSIDSSAYFVDDVSLSAS